MNFIKVVVWLSVLLLLSSCSEKESVESHLYKAKSYIKKNQVNESIIELKNAIRIDNTNSEARFLLGKTYLNQGNSVDAVKELERALKLKNNNELLIPLLARAYILTDSDDEVISLDNKASTLKGDALIQYLAYKTLALLRSEQAELAQSSAQKGKVVNPDSIYSKLAEAYLLFSEQRFEKARVIVNSILAVSPDNPDTLMLQGQVATAMQDYDLAAISYEKFLTLQPMSGIVTFLLSDSLLKSEQYEKAEQYADNILASLSTQPFANYIKAMARFQAKDYVKASEHAEVALSADFKQFNLKLVAGASAFYLNNWEQTNLYLSAISNYLPPEHQAKKMLAISQLELGLINNISETLNTFSSEDESDSQFITSLGYKLLELGAVDEARALVNKNEKFSAGAKVSARQGVLKLMMNDPSGLQDLENAVKLDPELIEAELALAYAAVQAGDVEQAKNIAAKWKNEYPDKAGSANLMAMIYIKEKKFSEAESALQESLQKEKDNIFALIEQVNIARYQEKVTLAEERISNLISLFPDNEKVQKLYFDIYRNENAVEMIVSSYQRDKSNIKKALLASEALVRFEKYESAFDILSDVKQDAKLPKKYWQLLLVVYKQQKNENQLLSTLESWRKNSPFHIEPIVLLVEFYSKKRDYNRALTLLNQSIEYNTDNLILKLVKMQILLNAKERYQAKELYRVIEKQDIKAELKLGMEGRILLLEEEFDLAIPKLAGFYKAYPSAQNLIYLASAYQGSGDEHKAIEVLEDFLVDTNNEQVKAILANIYLNSNKDKAIENYESVSETQPENIVANNNLAWLYMEKGDFDKALIYVKKAFSAGSKVANVADTYSQILLKSGDNRQALEKAELAIALSKGDSIDIQLNYIEALIANSRMNKAKTLLDKIEVHTSEQKTKLAKLIKQL